MAKGEILRFSRVGPADSAAAMASLALWRALAHHMVETKRLHPDEIDFIKASALGDLPAGTGDPVVDEARSLVEIEFP